jgi:hypothetical protein
MYVSQVRAQQLAGNYEEWKLRDVEWFKDTTAALHNHLQVGKP